MPYIKAVDKIRLANSVNNPSTNKFQGIGGSLKVAGELNYVITEIVQGYIEANGANYNTMNSAVGALECCKLELYRRLVSPYEDTKVAENGDVYK